MRSPFFLLAVAAFGACGWIGSARHEAGVRAREELVRARALEAALARQPLPAPRAAAGPAVRADPTWRAFVAKRRGSRIFAGWSPDRTPRVVAIDPNTGKRETAATLSGWPVRVSPDRKALALSQMGGSWVLTHDGTARRLADGPAMGAWGPDGQLLCLGDGRRFSIDGKELPRPPHAGGANEDWSPDGRWLLVAANRSDPENTWTKYGGNEQLSVVSVDGHEERPLTRSGRNGFARFSPDGRQVVYTHTETWMGDTGTARFGESSLWIVGTDGKNARRVLPQPDPRVDMRACWSPDGRRLAIAMNRDAGNRPRDASFVRRIQVIDLDGQVWRTFDLPGVCWIPPLDWK